MPTIADWTSPEAERACQRLETFTLAKPLARQRLERVRLSLDIGHLNDVLGDRAKLRRIVDRVVAKVDARDLHVVDAAPGERAEHSCPRFAVAEACHHAGMRGLIGFRRG